MEISVYLSKSFAGEHSKLYKVKSIKDEKVYRLNHKNENELVAIKKYELDYSTETTLSILYENGWMIKSTENIQQHWMMIFLEKD